MVSAATREADEGASFRQDRPSRRVGGKAEGPASAPRSVTIEVRTEQDIARSRQIGRSLTQEIGFSSAEACYVETSVSELACNLLFHTDLGGTLTFTVIEGRRGLGIEIVSEDLGPGIGDLDQAMQDGFSTNGGLGSGLPGVKRLMDEFALSSLRGKGTRVVVRKWKKRR